jgi:dTMP kinase
MRGRFIVIEGPDGAGTTFHAKLLAERLIANGQNVVLTAEPTDGPIGTFIRSVLKGHTSVPSSSLQLLFVADRAWHVETVILPALEAGKTVISDRYEASTIAYGISLGLDEQWLKDLNKNFIRPDVQILALPPISICLKRLSERHDRDILEEAKLQEKIHAAYAALAKSDPSIHVIDTSVDKEEAAAKIWKQISQE